MRHFLFLILLSTSSFAQMTTPNKALNSYVDYANQSAMEVESVVKSIMQYYPTIHKKTSWGSPRYTCPVQLDEFYYTTVQTQAKVLSATMSTPLNAKLKDLRAAAEKIDEKCKALDTYHKLEDYKQDNFAKAELIVNEFQLLVADYKKKQDALAAELAVAHKKLNPVENNYSKANDMIRDQIERERKFLDLWNFNVNEDVHTGWPVDKLEQSILETANQISAFQRFNPPLKYPASSMWSNFQSSLGSVLSVKRSGLDGYNYEAKKSDGHSNGVYLSLINYFNGTLVADQNAFIGYADNDGYHGLKAIRYFPLFEIRTQPKTTEVTVRPFKDAAHSPLTVTAQKIAITKPVYDVLQNYVEYVNETWRQIRLLRLSLVSFNSTASHFKGLESLAGRGSMSFDMKDFEVPLSHYQKTVADSRVLPPAIGKSLNEQSELILNILKEMNDLGALLEIETKEKKYEKDHLTKVYEILEREAELMNIWDERKEWLYEDVRKVFESYPPSQPTNSWYVSGKTLLQLTDLDREGLFKAKAFYKGDASITSISTEKIDEKLRDVIAKEYDNMKGIQKIGRNNGNCPYTPYEDLPISSKSLSEELKKLKPVGNKTGYEHPYYYKVYHYNDVVDDYNKFCELSKDIHHLKTVKQPEMFDVQYPDKKAEPTNTQAQAQKQEPQKQETPTPPVKTEGSKLPEKREEQTQNDPGRIVNTTKVQHDTVYIERRDTVYIADPGEDARSMEGYASNNMVLLLDVSGSMNTADKLPLLKKSVLDLLSMMRQEDEVSIIAFSEKPKAVLTGTSFKEESKIRKAINDLKSSGKTDGNAGVKLAYKVADENYIRGGNNRIILATDGEFVLNDETRALIEKFSRDDIYLSIFNFGKGAGASKSLAHLADLGKGNYRYVSPQNVDLTLLREAKAKKKK